MNTTNTSNASNTTNTNTRARELITSLEQIRDMGAWLGSIEAPTDDAIGAALSYDALAEAEKETGHSYKTDKDTGMRGMLDHVMHGGRKDALLRAADDTVLSNDLDRYLRIISEEGFEQVLRLPFVAVGYGGKDARDEVFYVFWHDADGLLLAFDTYNTTHVNGGNLYYNIRPKPGILPRNSSLRHGATSSGGWHGQDGDEANWIWSGNHDCREALRYHLRQLRAHGEFVTPWVDQPFVWLLHYMDTKDATGTSLPYSGYDHKAINKARIALLPAHVQAAITPAAPASDESAT